MQEGKTMRLSQKAIADFKKIYLNNFGVNISDEEANGKGLELLNFFQLIYKPISISGNDHVARCYSNCMKEDK